MHHYRDSGGGIDIAELRLALGRVTAITGLNGAGKTTPARVLCGLERGCEGVAELDGGTWRTRERPRPHSPKVGVLTFAAFPPILRISVTCNRNSE